MWLRLEKPDTEPIYHHMSWSVDASQWKNTNKWVTKARDGEDTTMNKSKRRTKNVWDPDRPVVLTGNTGWQESRSNVGSLYREIYVEIVNDRGLVQEIGPQYVDASMENYERNGWDKITELLDEGHRVLGRGCIVKSEHGDLYLDSDSFKFEGFEETK